LVECLDGLLADQRWFTFDANPELTSMEVARICAGPPALEHAAAALATGVPATIQHDDLHDDNVFVVAQHPRLIDWGDAVIAHPFSTLRVTLDVLGPRPRGATGLRGPHSGVGGISGAVARGGGVSGRSAPAV
jgi:aminoglycoside phosphotransferase (APT) family kinase protein